MSRRLVAANDADKVGTAGENVLRDAGKDAKRYSYAKAYRMAVNQAKPGTFKAEDNAFEKIFFYAIRGRLASRAYQGYR